MAKTDNPDVYVVKPSWVQRVIDGKARTVWYLKMLNKQQVRELTVVGNTVRHTTKEGRKVTVHAVNDVTSGTVYNINGVIVTVADKTASSITPDKPQSLVNSDIHDEAHNAGMQAGESCQPTPMMVVQRSNPFDDNSPIVKSWEPVQDGVCGFAWINVRPGTCSFARWASKQDLAHKSYYGGVDIWVPFFNQSMTRKEAYAAAYANVLRSHGIDARSMSRMD